MLPSIASNAKCYSPFLAHMNAYAVPSPIYACHSSRPWSHCPPIACFHREPTHLQLHVIVHQPYLLPRLERRQPNVRAPITPERIPQSAVSTTADLSLDREIYFGELIGLEFRC